MSGYTEKDNEELAKILNFLDEADIEYDLEAPVMFDKWETVGDVTYLRTKEIDIQENNLMEEKR
jgi:hypothetical protein